MTTTEKSSFFNSFIDADGNYDRAYNAEDFAAFFADAIEDGVARGLNIVPQDNMTVVVTPGAAFYKGYRYELLEPKAFNVAANGQYKIILTLNLFERNITLTLVDSFVELADTGTLSQTALYDIEIPQGAATTQSAVIKDVRE